MKKDLNTEFEELFTLYLHPQKKSLDFLDFFRIFFEWTIPRSKNWIDRWNWLRNKPLNKQMINDVNFIQSRDLTDIKRPSTSTQNGPSQIGSGNIKAVPGWKSLPSRHVTWRSAIARRDIHRLAPTGTIELNGNNKAGNSFQCVTQPATNQYANEPVQSSNFFSLQNEKFAWKWLTAKVGKFMALELGTLENASFTAQNTTDKANDVDTLHVRHRMIVRLRLAAAFKSGPAVPPVLRLSLLFQFKSGGFSLAQGDYPAVFVFLLSAHTHTTSEQPLHTPVKIAKWRKFKFKKKKISSGSSMCSSD